MVNFFIHRPIFASAIAIIMVLAGVRYFLPVSQFPDITPPQVVVSAIYPGASAQVVADTVTTPLEQQINGVAGMTYMSSSAPMTARRPSPSPSMSAIRSTSRRSTSRTASSQARRSLPAIVNQAGVTIKKQNPNFVLIVNLTSPDNSVDPVALSNYAYLQIVDPLKRLPGVGDVQIFGERRYSMRVWLDPDKLANLGITAVDVQNAIAEQNVQVAAGKIGQSPAPAGTAFEMQVNALGRLSDPAQFGDIVVRADREAKPWCGCATSRASSLARCNIRRPRFFERAARRSCSPSSRCRARTRSICSSEVKAKMEELGEALPEGNRLRHALRHDARSSRRRCMTW